MTDFLCKISFYSNPLPKKYKIKNKHKQTNNKQQQHKKKKKTKQNKQTTKNKIKNTKQSLPEYNSNTLRKEIISQLRTKEIS